ncbi:MAG TPA: hypothetical protein VFQ13_10545 [Anaerolineales bacterium]|nr:hypothetical protein [Anaerolineales bacterium]
MDSSFREQEAPKSFLAGLKILTSLINWLAGLLKLTEEEREDVGIYLGRPGPGGE